MRCDNTQTDGYFRRGEPPQRAPPSDVQDEIFGNFDLPGEFQLFRRLSNNFHGPIDASGGNCHDYCGASLNTVARGASLALQGA